MLFRSPVTEIYPGHGTGTAQHASCAGELRTDLLTKLCEAKTVHTRRKKKKQLCHDLLDENNHVVSFELFYIVSCDEGLRCFLRLQDGKNRALQ